MALSRIKKVFLLTLPSARDEVLSGLQKMSSVQFVSVESQFAEQLTIKKSETESRITGIIQKSEDKLTRVKWIIDRLEKIRPKKSFIENLVTPKEFVSLDEFENIEQFSINSIYEDVQKIEEEEHKIQKQFRQNNHILYS